VADGSFAIGAGDVYGFPRKLCILKQQAYALQAGLDHVRLLHVVCSALSRVRDISRGGQKITACGEDLAGSTDFVQKSPGTTAPGRLKTESDN
jgi:hypothetical protein